jgi:serine/threonine-protein kinase PknG
LASLNPPALAAALESAPMQTLEVTLTAARARIDLGQIAEAIELLDPLTSDGDWRTHWYLAAADLAAGNGPAARDRFDALYSLLPGETAPRLGLAMACELTGDLPGARRHYQSIWTRDAGQLSAAFGLARVLLAGEELNEALVALHSVPQNSARYETAQIAAIAALVRDTDPLQVASEPLRASAQALADLKLDAVRHARLAAQLLTTAIAQAAVQPGGDRLFDAEFTEPTLRAELERTYRSLARAATDRTTRHALVDQANRVRPRTLV